MLGVTVKFICLHDLHIVVKNTHTQKLSRRPDVALEMTGPSSIRKMFIQLRMSFFFMVLFFFHSPRLAQFSANVLAILLSSGT